MMAVKDSYTVKVRSDGVAIGEGSATALDSLDIELTERCNNNCIHCYINLPADDHRAQQKELSTRELQEIIREAVSLGCLTVRFTGGEPLVRQDFEDLYIFARKLGLRVALVTNATLVTPALAKVFAHTPPLMPIEITLYGMTRNAYETITRVPGSFEAAWKGIHLLSEHQVPFVVAGVLLPPNGKEVEEFESWASTIPWMDTAPSYTLLLNLRARLDSVEKNVLIKGLRPSPEDVVTFLSRKQEKYLKEMKEFCSKFIRIQGNNLFSCGAGIRGGCIDAYGNLQPCILLRHPDTIYDLKKGSLKDALTKFFPKIRQMKSENPDYLARCAHCFLKGLCEQCPAWSWMEHGTLDTPVDYLCEVAHAQARAFGLLAENERAWQIKNGEKRIKNFIATTHTIRHTKEVCNELKGHA